MIPNRARTLVSRVREEIGIWRRVVRDPRTPWLARVLVGGAVAYAVSPLDLIPDFVPVIGHVDDLLIVPLLIWLGTRLVPAQVIRDARAAVRTESRLRREEAAAGPEPSARP